MEWPSKRVPQGGLFHPPKVSYNPDTRDFLKALINESKLSIIQREKDRCSEKVKQNSNLQSLKSVSESHLSIREPLLTRPGSSKKRTQDTIVNSGAYVREKFVPKFPKIDGEKAKRHLQDLMTYGKDIQPPPPPRVIPKPKSGMPPENRFDQLEREIKERREFLQEMKNLGEGPKYEQIIEQQIQAKLREMKKLEFERDQTKNPFQRKHLAALILARGGSNGIPLKNLAKVGNITILRRSINVVLRSNIFDSVWVSTENDLIYKEASKVNGNIHWRLNETATDTASSLYAVQEFLVKHHQIDFVALIQCTSPFLKVKYLQEAVTKLNFKVYECVFSVTRFFKLRWFKTGYQFLPSFDIKNRLRRQDLKEEYVENGMFYFASRNLIEKGYFQNYR